MDEQKECRNTILNNLYTIKENIKKINLLGMKIENLNLTPATYNSLKNIGLDTMKYIVMFCAKHKLEEIEKLGTNTITELKQRVLEHGINLDDRLQCQELLDEYDNKKDENFKLYLSNLEESIKALILSGNKELIEFARQQLLELDKMDKEGMEKCNAIYDEIIKKENSNNHGTK